jgi:hypothetical protein
VGSFSLGLGEECASAVGAGRRRRYQAMKVWRGKIQLKCADGRKLLTWLLWGAPLSEGRPYCLLDWQGARAPIAYLIGRGLVQKLGGLVNFLLLLVAAKS